LVCENSSQSVLFCGCKAKHDVVQREIFFHPQLHKVWLGQGSLTAFFSVGLLGSFKVLGDPGFTPYLCTGIYKFLSDCIREDFKEPLSYDSGGSE